MPAECADELIPVIKRLVYSVLAFDVQGLNTMVKFELLSADTCTANLTMAVS